MEDENKNASAIEKIIDGGSSILGGTAGSLIGGALGTIGGPGGIIAGAAAGSVVGTGIEMAFKRMGQEIKEKLLSKSEVRKIQTVYDIAKTNIEKRVEQGNIVRDDDFFDSTVDDRSAADEILEGVLFAAQRESEEKKLPFLANLYTNLVFDKTTNREMANQILKLAENMTYREMIIISTIGFFQLGTATFGKVKGGLRNKAYGTIKGENEIGILTEVYKLIHSGIIRARDIPLDIPLINPSTLSIGGIGAKIFHLMELYKLPSNEVTKSVVNILTDDT